MNTRRLFSARSVFLCFLSLLLLFPCPSAFAGRYASVKLIVSAYALSSGSIEAGGRTTLSVTVQNTNAYAGAKNIVFTLEDAQGRVLPEGPSGVYVESISRGGSAQVSFTLFALPDAHPGYARLTLSAGYEDDETNVMSMQSDLYIEISQPMRLEHGPAALPSRCVEGDNIGVAIDLLNMGKGAVYNALLSVSVPGLNGGSAVLVGTIEPGESKTGRTNLLVSSLDGEYGPTEGTLELTWENAAGQLFEKRLPLSTEIAKKVVIQPSDMAEAEEEPLLPAWFPSSMIALAGVGAIIAIQITIDRRRRRERDEKLL